MKSREGSGRREGEGRTWERNGGCVEGRDDVRKEWRMWERMRELGGGGEDKGRMKGWMLGHG